MRLLKFQTFLQCNRNRCRKMFFGQAALAHDVHPARVCPIFQLDQFFCRNSTVSCSMFSSQTQIPHDALMAALTVSIITTYTTAYIITIITNTIITIITTMFGNNDHDSEPCAEKLIKSRTGLLIWLLLGRLPLSELKL